MQNYYGMCIRENVNNFYCMKKNIAAILYPCSEDPDNEKRHQYCPPGENSWCKYQNDKVTGKSMYKIKINIPTAVHNIIKPIYSHQDLATDSLLEKYLHAETQNANESFNG